jgi:hypothetical protein
MSNQPSNDVTIYGLVDPRDSRIRYVGKTSVTLNTRLRAHLNDVRRGRVYIPRHKWLSELLAAGLVPSIVELECVLDGSWQEAETRWIAALPDLLNATAGGDGLCSYRHRADTKEKQRQSALRRSLDPAVRAKRSAAIRRAFAVPETREKLRQAARRRDPRILARWIAGGTAYARSEEGRRRTSQRSKGRLVSAETRAKLSLARTGQRRSPESIEKGRKKMAGRSLSEAHKAAIAAAHRRRYPEQPNPLIQCACGCGASLKQYDSDKRPRRFINGHNGRQPLFGGLATTQVATP